MAHNRNSVSGLVAVLTVLAATLIESRRPLESTASAAYFQNNVFNTTLDTDNSMSTYWQSSYKYSKWFEYYNSSTDFKNNESLSTTCAHSFTDWDNFLSVDATGVWVACHDDKLPEDCVYQPSAPCHPVITYSSGSASYNIRMRTAKVKFAIYGLGILRLNFQGTGDGSCVDYSLRKDPFSSCGFMKQEPLADNEAWRWVRFTFDPIQNISFFEIKMELISRFKNDFVLVDKVEATTNLLCSGSGIDPEEEIMCPPKYLKYPITQPQPTTTPRTRTTTTTQSTSEFTTLETEVTTQTRQPFLFGTIFYYILLGGVGIAGVALIAIFWETAVFRKGSASNKGKHGNNGDGAQLLVADKGDTIPIEKLHALYDKGN